MKILTDIFLKIHIYTIESNNKNKRINSKFFFFSLYWLKFELTKLKLINFNLKPASTDEERPLVYREMCEKVKLLINQDDKKFFENFSIYKSKKMCSLPNET